MRHHFVRVLFVMLAIATACLLAHFQSFSLQAADKPAEQKANSTDKSKGVPPAVKAVPVLVGEAVRGDMPLLINAIGSVQAGATAEIKSRIVGELQKVHFSEGQFVKKGDILFSIDPRPFEAALQAAKAQLNKSKAQLSKAQEDKRRYDELLRQQIISRDQQETTATSLAVLQAQIASDQAAVELAQVQLSYTIIRSPIDGRTGEIKIQTGNMIKANDDTSMVIIQQIEPVDVRFTLPEVNLNSIRAQQAKAPLLVRAALNGLNGTEEGLLNFIDSSVDTKTGTIALKASFPNHGKNLWPGQFVNVTLQLGLRKDVVLVPSQAVSAGSEGNFVYIVKADNVVEYRLVKVGATMGAKTLIESGLQGGEKVVTDGHLRLAPGVPVEIKSGAEGGGNQ